MCGFVLFFSIRKRKGEEVDGNATAKKKPRKEKEKESKHQKQLKVSFSCSQPKNCFVGRGQCHALTEEL